MNSNFYEISEQELIGGSFDEDEADYQPSTEELEAMEAFHRAQDAELMNSKDYRDYQGQVEAEDGQVF
jgi:hypothetical protein